MSPCKWRMAPTSIKVARSGHTAPDTDVRRPSSMDGGGDFSDSLSIHYTLHYLHRYIAVGKKSALRVASTAARSCCEGLDHRLIRMEWRRSGGPHRLMGSDRREPLPGREANTSVRGPTSEGRSACSESGRWSGGDEVALVPHRRHGAGREPPVQGWANGLIARTLWSDRMSCEGGFGPRRHAPAGSGPPHRSVQGPRSRRPRGECFSKHALRGSGGPARGGLLLLGGHRGHVLRGGMRPGFV